MRSRSDTCRCMSLPFISNVVMRRFSACILCVQSGATEPLHVPKAFSYRLSSDMKCHWHIGRELHFQSLPKQYRMISSYQDETPACSAKWFAVSSVISAFACSYRVKSSISGSFRRSQLAESELTGHSASLVHFLFGCLDDALVPYCMELSTVHNQSTLQSSSSDMSDAHRSTCSTASSAGTALTEVR